MAEEFPGPGKSSLHVSLREGESTHRHRRVRPNEDPPSGLQSCSLCSALAGGTLPWADSAGGEPRALLAAPQVTGPSELMGTILPGYLRHTDRTRRPCLALPFRMTLPGSRHRHPNPCVPWSISSSHKDTENCCERRSEAEAVGLRARRPGPGPGVPRLCCSLPFAGLPRGVRREEKLEHFL